MAQTGSDALIETLMDWGVEIVFGLPGDGINGIMEALRTRQDKIRFIQVRHEEAAAFMACGYAKYTGRLGVCLATSGPGGIHLLNGLYDAKLDGQPVLAITGMHYHDLIGTRAQQDVELDKLFMDVAVFNQRVMGPNHVAPLTDLACRTALSYRGVAHIAFPVDLQEEEVSKKDAPKRVKHHETSGVWAAPAHLPRRQDLERAAEVLNAGSKVAILAGRGALTARSELEQAAETLGAPIIKALLGKAAVPDDSPYCTGGIGLLGTKPSQEVMESCDTLLMVGTSFPYIEFYPKPDAARAVQIDLDPARIGLRYPVEVGLVGDSKRTLEHLLPLLKRNPNRDFLGQAQVGVRDWWMMLEESASVMDTPMKPQVLARELGKRLAPDAIVSCDSGTVTSWWARYMPARPGQMYSCSGNLASMACGLPYAIAAQLAWPERQSVAFVGDGAFSMLMAEFATAVKYKLPIKVFVVKNNTLGQIKWEQMVFLGNPEYGCDLQPIDFAAAAQACGGAGLTVEDPRDCGKVLDQALATPGPVLVQALVDPFEPPMPPKVNMEQARHFAESLARGEADASKIARTVLVDRIRELV
ncbi:MAG TPA: thiamine pyrophosphate-dependent enzyme [Bryobacteraceae bacterium]|nr:thiamine pyrophosphate-dependent enzyme [Bryobacteraceae bacterium]